jgi:hypothetical protein
MTVFDLFSKRQKRLRGEVPDVYQYDKIPKELRVQIVHVCTDTLGNSDDYEECSPYNGHQTVEAYKFIVETLCREYGIFRLPGTREGRERHYLTEVANFILSEEDSERVLDATELACRLITRLTTAFTFLGRNNGKQLADDAIQELNARFAEHAVGYRYETGEIIRVDSQFVHQEIVKPALRLLSSPDFRGSQEEFLQAHHHYRKGEHKTAMNEALKSFESTLKTICKRRKWAVQENATSKVLLDAVFANGLVPPFWQNHMAALRALLEGGVPVGRNRLSGHGQGTDRVDVPQHIAGYVMHMTASAIVFLVEAEGAV